MEGFTYNNIFATKGIEYIIILLFLMLLVPFWMFISRGGNVKKEIKSAVNVLTAGALRIPQGLFFSKNHSWVHLEKTGEARIGLDDFLTHVVGNAEVKQVVRPGEKVRKGEIIAEVLQEDKKLQVYSPVSGEVLAVNAEAGTDSEILKNDPYNSGWLYAVKPTNWKAETSGFYLAEEASEWIKNELSRFKDFLNISVAKYSPQPAMVTLQEGGEIKAGPLAELQPEVWNDFQKEFLD